MVADPAKCPRSDESGRKSPGRCPIPDSSNQFGSVGFRGEQILRPQEWFRVQDHFHGPSDCGSLGEGRMGNRTPSLRIPVCFGQFAVRSGSAGCRSKQTVFIRVNFCPVPSAFNPESIPELSVIRPRQFLTRSKRRSCSECGRERGGLGFCQSSSMRPCPQLPATTRAARLLLRL